jgi:hypothetical protein
MSESDRRGIMERLRGQKAPRPAVEDQDNLGNRRIDPKKGKKSLTVWVEPSVIYQIKLLAAELQVKQQDLLAEFLNDGFEKYHKARIA